MSQFEAWSIVISSVTALISLGALVFVGLQVRQGVRAAVASAEAQEAEWVRQRRERTLEFYSTTLERRRANQSLLPAPYDRGAVEAFLQRVRQDPEAAGRLRAYLSDWELAATGINLGVLDEDVVDRFIGTSAIATWRNYYPYVREQRKLREETSVYAELEVLAYRLAERHGIPLGAK